MQRPELRPRSSACVSDEDERAAGNGGELHDLSWCYLIWRMCQLEIGEFMIRMGDEQDYKMR